MNDADVLVKTARGQDELRTRSAGLPQRLRSVLIMVDGAMAVAQLRTSAVRAGAPPDAPEALLRLGLVELQRRNLASTATLRDRPLVVPPAPHTRPAELADPAAFTERYRAAQKYMNDQIVDALGLRAFMFTLKLERCSTLADLRALEPEFARLIEKARGHERAVQASAALRDLLD